MLSLHTICKRLRDVSFQDFCHIFLFLVAIPIAFIFKRHHRNLWLVCEDKMEARDNGFAFFKYVCQTYPEQEIYYAISKNSPDFPKVKKIGKTIAYGTLQHWIYYLSASQNISSQKGGKPSAAVCYLLEVGGLLKNSRIFLQHGITKDDMPWLYYQNCRFKLFVCGAEPEYQFVKKKFGYPPPCVQLLGFPRFDFLHENITDTHLLVAMPTWRNWFYLKSNNPNGKVADVENSLYIKAWKEFLNSAKLHQILEKYNLKLLFYPHRNMQPYINLFCTTSSRIVLGKREEYDVQQLLRKAALLITDYSSVFFDMIYMKKPILFYQFDEQEFRARQYAQGYFDYADNPFSIRHTSLDCFLSELERYVNKKFQVSEKFLEGHARYFPLYDAKNCERIFQYICDLES